MLPRPPGASAPPSPGGPPPSMSQVGASAGAGMAPPGEPQGGAPSGAFTPQDLQKLSQVLTPDVIPLVLKIAGAGMIDAFKTVLEHLGSQGGASPGGPAPAGPAPSGPGAPPNMPTGVSGQPLQ